MIEALREVIRRLHYPLEVMLVYRAHVRRLCRYAAA